MAVCSYEGCERPFSAKGFCVTHYNMHNKGVTLRPIGKQGRKIQQHKGCSVPDCKLVYRAKGYCSEHYSQIKKNGVIKEKTIRPEYWGKKICRYDDCQNKKQNKGYCTTHYKKVILGFIPKPRGVQNKKPKAKCEVDNCDTMARVKGLCDKHYLRMRKHGDTGINYHRKYRAKKICVDNPIRPHMKYCTTADEREVIAEMFGAHDDSDCNETYY